MKYYVFSYKVRRQNGEEFSATAVLDRETAPKLSDLTEYMRKFEKDDKATPLWFSLREITETQFKELEKLAIEPPLTQVV